MTIVSKAVLRTEVSSTYIDNITGQITPTSVRTLDNDLIDSLLSQIVPGTGAGAGSLLYWSDSSTTAQLILGASGTLLTAGATAPAWGAFSFASAIAAGSPETLSGSGVLALSGASGTLLNGVVGTGSQFTTTAQLGVPGTTPGIIRLAGSTSPSLISLQAAPAGSSISFIFPPSMGTANQLLRTDGANTTSWVTTGQLLGDATGVAASSGNMGQYLSSLVSPGAAMTSTVSLNAASLSLTAGDWDVWGQLSLTTTSSYSMTLLQASLGTNSNVVSGLTASQTQLFLNLAFVGSNGLLILPVGQARMLFSTTTTVYMAANATFSAGSGTAGGLIAARLRR